MPRLSEHFQTRAPSVIRVAQIRFAERKDGTEAINVAIGNVSLPMHPALTRRMHALGGPDSPFREGVVKYSETVGFAETRQAFLNILASSGLPTDGLHVQIADGASQAMELVLLGCCGPAGSHERPLLLIDAAYTNYKAFAERTGRATVSVQRTLQPDGRFTLPRVEEIDKVVRASRPGALLVIPYDNPTGQLYDHASMVALAQLCVEHDLWIISDEAYRELSYTGPQPAVSIWRVTEREVPGITGRRISLETASKVWNVCGLRVGALITDNEEFHRRSVAEQTATLCPNVLGQWVFGALAHESHEDLRAWYGRQRAYYQAMMVSFTEAMRAELPGIIVSRPDASIYSVVDVREVVRPGFDGLQFVLWCATRGRVDLDGKAWTVLTASMDGFYSVPPGLPNPGRTQLRLAYVATPERMKLVPRLLAAQIRAYDANRG